MTEFMGKDFLLHSPTAKHLFHDYAEELPLIDYHCHIPPREIAENRRFENITQAWLGGTDADGNCFGDHYKWRILRSDGVPESRITGSEPDRDRFMAFAKALPLCPGNPMYHWCHLELQRYFDINEPLNEDTAPAIWDTCNRKLQQDSTLRVRGIVAKSNVAMIGTTDDPVDDLFQHKAIAADSSVTAKVYPSFRPDKAINLTKPGFAAYMEKLARSVGKDSLNSCREVCEALLQRLDFFAEMGCRASDHGLDYIPYRPCPEETADTAFRKAMNGEKVTSEEAEGYQTTLLMALGRAYHEKNIVMQLHYSALRNANTAMFRRLGADTGFDIIGRNDCIASIAGFLDALTLEGCCPKTILYSLDPADMPLLGALMGAFQGTEIPGKIQLGSGWWFNDTKGGMERQLRTLGELGMIGNFVGMLTDSRSFLSYTRHEYFRRIFCNFLGDLVEQGEYPQDEKALAAIVRGVSFENAYRYFDLSE